MRSPGLLRRFTPRNDEVAAAPAEPNISVSIIWF